MINQLSKKHHLWSLYVLENEPACHASRFQIGEYPRLHSMTLNKVSDTVKSHNVGEHALILVGSICDFGTFA